MLLATLPMYSLSAADVGIGQSLKLWDSRGLGPAEIRRLREVNPELGFIQSGVKKEFDINYAVTVVYGDSTSQVKKKIGVFVIDQRSNKIVITLDILTSDFDPSIREATANEAILAFGTDYGEITRKQYFFDLKTLKLVNSKDLPPAERTGKCFHNGKPDEEDCFD